MEVTNYLLAITLAIAFLGLTVRLKDDTKRVPGAVIHGYRSIIEPTLLVKSRFVFGALDIVGSGYKKFKNVPFVVRRYDADYSILPIKFLSELRLVPSAVLSGRNAQIRNMMPKWTDMEFLTRSHLHVNVLKNKLAPELPHYLDLARKELDYGWSLDVPQPKDWAEVDIQHITRMLISRMSAKVFLGFPACRNEEWLKVSIDYSIDAFTTAFILRMFPTWSHFIVARLLPSRYRMKREVQTAMKVISSLIEKREENIKRRNRGERVKDDDDTLMRWMLDHGTEEEIKLPEMATRQCVLTLASIHTTATNTANVLFDLCAHPEWFPVLREEILEVNRAIGSLDEQPDTGVRRWHSRLEKLDSFLMETLRFSPPIILSPQRLALKSLTLSDGTQIQAGTKISFANYHHMHDPEVVPNPQMFDPMRSYRKRRASPEEYHRHQAWLTSINENLSFGYGNQACPGRFFAVAEVKMVIARFLTDFEFKFPEGRTRPSARFADENSFIDPSARLLMKKRKAGKGSV